MKTITLYMTRLFVSRFLLILFGVTALALALDIFTFGEEVLASRPRDPWALVQYAGLSIPGIVSQFFNLVTLMAFLLALTELSRNNELIVIWNAGTSQAQIFLTLAPLAIGIGLFHFIIDDQAAPRASAYLYEWGVGKFNSARYQRNDNAPIWMKSGRDFIRATSNDESTNVLKGVIIFRRGSDGLLLEQIEADRAKRENDHWRLENVRIYSAHGGDVITLKDMVYYGKLKPAATGRVRGIPNEMRLSQLIYFSQNAGFGVRPSYVYTTWVHKRITTMLTGLLALLIAVPIAHRFRRGGGFGILFILGIAAGFAYFIFSGVALAMGQAGVLPPWLAGWIAPLTLLTISGTIALQFESS